MGQSHKIYQLLNDQNSFFSLSLSVQKQLLDILCFIMRNSIYNIIRFRCQVEAPVSESRVSIFESYSKQQPSLVAIIIRLLQHQMALPSANDSSSLLIGKRLIRLIGIVSLSGITSLELKNIISMLSTPSMLAVSLLQGLKIMLRVNDGIVKASPFSLFNFGGEGAGLLVQPNVFFFPREFQIMFWFRIENFMACEQPHFVVLKQKTCGLDIFLEEENYIVVAINYSNGDVSTFKLEKNPIARGVWYNFSLRRVFIIISFC